jgi:hypothetical protein
MSDIEILEARVHNLELALHIMISVVREMAPPALQDTISQMSLDHFDSSKSLGGFDSVAFIELEAK